MMKKIILAQVTTLFSMLLLAQQSVTVRVVDSKTNDPIPNATVKIKNTGKGGSTNAQGLYQIQAAPNEVVEISSVGYTTALITLKGESEISVPLEPATVDLSDVVIVGTRGAPRAKTETPVPVDVIKTNQGRSYHRKNGACFCFKYNGSFVQLQ